MWYLLKTETDGSDLFPFPLCFNSRSFLSRPASTPLQPTHPNGVQSETTVSNNFRRFLESSIPDRKRPETHRKIQATSGRGYCFLESPETAIFYNFRPEMAGNRIFSPFPSVGTIPQWAIFDRHIDIWF